MSENTWGKVFAERVNRGLKVAAREQTEGRRRKKSELLHLTGANFTAVQENLAAHQTWARHVSQMPPAF